MQLGQRLGVGKQAEVFEYGDDVLKLYPQPSAKPSAFREAAILAVIGQGAASTRQDNVIMQGQVQLRVGGRTADAQASLSL